MNTLEKAWQTRGVLAILLFPVSMLFYALVVIRRALFKAKLLRQNQFEIPVVVVGNISVGGTGKSPLTAALVSEFQAMGWKPGIVARGYGGTEIDTPQNVTPESNASEVGDEPVMLSRSTGVPVCVCRDRTMAVRSLIANKAVNIVFSDDGMQHYRMGRDAEIAVVDASRGLQNGWMLPAGPLREPKWRLKSVTCVAVHRALPLSMVQSASGNDSQIEKAGFHLVQTSLRRLSSGESCDEGVRESTHESAHEYMYESSDERTDEGDDRSIYESTGERTDESAEESINRRIDKSTDKISDESQAVDVNHAVDLNEHSHESLSMLSGVTVNAVAGIGHPERFFRQLERAGITVMPHPKPDHHEWTHQDLIFNNNFPVVITSKDAVKVRPLLNKHATKHTVYEVCVEAVLDANLSWQIAQLEDRLHRQYCQVSTKVFSRPHHSLLEANK